MIKEITIKALKSISEMNFTCKNLNIIAGTNSSGKSTLLQALLIAAQNTDSNNGINGKYVNIGEFKDANNYNVKDKEIRVSGIEREIRMDSECIEKLNV